MKSGIEVSGAYSLLRVMLNDDSCHNADYSKGDNNDNNDDNVNHDNNNNVEEHGTILTALIALTMKTI